MQARPNVLIICDDDCTYRSLETILEDCSNLTRVRDTENLEWQANRSSFDTVFCAWTFGAGSWMSILSFLRNRLPDAPVIVFNHSGGEEQWMEVLEAGGFDLLAAPYRKSNVVPLLEHAASTYEARCLNRMAAAS